MTNNKKEPFDSGPLLNPTFQVFHIRHRKLFTCLIFDFRVKLSGGEINSWVIKEVSK